MLKPFPLTIAVIILLGVPDSVLFGQTNFWEQTGLTTNNWITSLAVNSTGNIFAGASWDGIFRSTDGGGNWTAVNAGLSPSPLVSLAINPIGDIFASKGWAEYAAIYRSTNNGDNWTEVVDSIWGHIAINSVGHIFVGLGGVLRSTDNGISWPRVLTGPVSKLAINPSGHIFVAGSEVYRSTDNGDSWTLVNNGLTYPVEALAIAPNSDIFAGTSSCTPGSCEGWGIFRSTNNGDNWAQTGLDSLQVEAIAINSSGDIFAGTRDPNTNNGYDVYRSTNNGSTWEEVSSGLTDSTWVRTLSINSSGRIFAGTGHSVFRSVQSTVGVEELSTYVPAAFMLEQNYPNPFNPATKFGFRIAEFGMVTLTVYNLIGQEVATLVNEVKQPGSYEVTWDPSTSSGQVLASGVYFYRLTAGNFVETKKLILLR